MENKFELFLNNSNRERTALVRFSQRYLWPVRAWFGGDWKHFAALKGIMDIQPGERVLEVGVGTYLDGFTNYSSDAKLFVGLDIDQKTVEKLNRWAKENERKERFLLGDGTELPFKDGSFDKVLFNNFLGDYGKCISEARRVLRKGGRIFIGFVTHPFYFRPKELMPDMPGFWESRGFKCLIPLGWTEKTRTANYYYLTVAEKS